MSVSTEGSERTNIVIVHDSHGEDWYELLLSYELGKNTSNGQMSEVTLILTFSHIVS